VRENDRMNNDKRVATSNSDDDLVSVGGVGVLDRLHSYVYAPIKDEDSGRTQCRYNKYVDKLCNYVAAKESLKYTKVYPAIVSIGYGVWQHNKNGNGDLLLDVSVRLKELRSSDSENDRNIASRFESTTVHFQGDRRAYRFDKTVIGQISD